MCRILVKCRYYLSLANSYTSSHSWPTISVYILNYTPQIKTVELASRCNWNSRRFSVTLIVQSEHKIVYSFLTINLQLLELWTWFLCMTYCLVLITSAKLFKIHWLALKIHVWSRQGYIHIQQSIVDNYVKRTQQKPYCFQFDGGVLWIYLLKQLNGKLVVFNVLTALLFFF